jgi:hypothetical protein
LLTELYVASGPGDRNPFARKTWKSVKGGARKFIPGRWFC